MTSCFRCLLAPIQRTVLEVRPPSTEATAPVEATTSASEMLDHILRTHRTHKAYHCPPPELQVGPLDEPHADRFAHR